MPAFLYILRCSDDSYYVGTTRGTLELRVAEHNAAHYGGYTAKRRPVALVFHEEFDRITDAIAAERQGKGWPREEKEALLPREVAGVRLLGKRGGREWGAGRRILPSGRRPAPRRWGSFLAP